MVDDYYTITTPAATGPTWAVPGWSAAHTVALADGIYYYTSEYVDDHYEERIFLLGTPATMAVSPVLVAENILAPDARPHDAGLYGFQKFGVSTLGALNDDLVDVWEVNPETGDQTFITWNPAVSPFFPARWVDCNGESQIRSYTDEFVDGYFLFGPEDGVIWVVVPPAGGEDLATELPSYPGVAALPFGGVDDQIYEDLPALDPPYDVPVTLTAALVDPFDTGDPQLWFSYTLDDWPDGYDGLPSDFWEGAVFEYSWAGGWPGAGIPGGGTATTRLYANYEASPMPIAGDGIGSALTDPGIAAIGYGTAPGDPYYGLAPGWTVAPTTGPGYEANLSEGIASMTIAGSYTVTPDRPYRITYPRVDYSFYPASDLTSTALDVSAWGAPDEGPGPYSDRVTSDGWRRFNNRHWNAYSALWRLTHYPYGADDGDDGTTRAYDINQFTIAIRYDDLVVENITEAFELARCRFVRSRP